MGKKEVLRNRLELLEHDADRLFKARARLELLGQKSAGEIGALTVRVERLEGEREKGANKTTPIGDMIACERRVYKLEAQLADYEIARRIEALEAGETIAGEAAGKRLEALEATAGTLFRDLSALEATAGTHRRDLSALEQTTRELRRDLGRCDWTVGERTGGSVSQRLHALEVGLEALARTVDKLRADLDGTTVSQAKRLFSARDLAEAWAMPTDTVRTWIRRGRLRGVRLGTAVRVPAAEVEAFLGRGGAYAPPTPANQSGLDP